MDTVESGDQIPVAPHGDLIDQAVRLQKPPLGMSARAGILLRIRRGGLPVQAHVDIQAHQLQLQQLQLPFLSAADLCAASRAVHFDRHCRLIEGSAHDDPAEIAAGVQGSPVDRDPGLPQVSAPRDRFRLYAAGQKPSLQPHSGPQGTGCCPADLQGQPDRLLLFLFFSGDRLSAQAAVPHPLAVGLQRAFRPALRHAALGAARTRPGLDPEFLLHGFKEGLLLAAGRDQEFLDILQAALLHGESPVEGPVLLRGQDLLQTLLVKQGRRPLEILLRQGEEVLLAPDLRPRRILCFLRCLPVRGSSAAGRCRPAPGCPSALQGPFFRDLHCIGDRVFPVGRDHTKTAADRPARRGAAGVELPADISCPGRRGRELFAHAVHTGLGRVDISPRRFPRPVADPDHTLPARAALGLKSQPVRLEDQSRIRHVEGLSLHVFFRVIISHDFRNIPFLY